MSSLNRISLAMVGLGIVTIVVPSLPEPEPDSPSPQATVKIATKEASAIIFISFILLPCRGFDQQMEQTFPTMAQIIECQAKQVEG
jgi:hypothetical protein